MHLDMDINYFALCVAKVSRKKLQVQPLPVKGNVSVPKVNDMTHCAKLLAHYSLKKSWMTFLDSTK